MTPFYIITFHNDIVLNILPDGVELHFNCIYIERK